VQLFRRNDDSRTVGRNDLRAARRDIERGWQSTSRGADRPAP